MLVQVRKTPRNPPPPVLWSLKALLLRLPAFHRRRPSFEARRRGFLRVETAAAKTTCWSSSPRWSLRQVVSRTRVCEAQGIGDAKLPQLTIGERWLRQIISFSAILSITRPVNSWKYLIFFTVFNCTTTQLDCLILLLFVEIKILLPHFISF